MGKECDVCRSTKAIYLCYKCDVAFNKYAEEVKRGLKDGNKNNN